MSPADRTTLHSPALPCPHSAPCVSLVMPCLNEMRTVASCIGAAEVGFDQLDMPAEIIVADNDSTDRSVAVAAAAGARVITVHERGYGNAIMGGIIAARSEHIIIGDADGSYDFTDVGAFVDKLRDGYDLVVGNRFAGGISQGAMPLLHRYIGNPLLSGIGRLIFGSPCRDFHCGLRAFRKPSIMRLGLCAPGMEFASEMVIKATLQRLRITEVPTVLLPDAPGRKPHLRPWRDGWRHLSLMLSYGRQRLPFRNVAGTEGMGRGRE